MSAEPTGREHLTPVRLRETSVTERAVFRACRRKWLLSTIHRLQAPGANESFWIGELLHAGLAAYYSHPLQDGERRERSGRARAEALAAYDAAADGAVATVRDELGFLWEYGREPWEEAVRLGRAMLDAYFRYDRSTGGIGRVVVVERRWRVRIPGTTGRLTLRIDLVAVDDRGRLAVVDHKSAAQRLQDAMLDIDDQFTAYFWGYHAETGEWPDRVVRNILYKREAKPPRLLKSGKLSKDKDQSTTYELYLEEVKRLGLPRAEYEDMLSYLAGRDWEQFFERQSTIRTQGQMAEFERNLRTEWRDMRRVASHPEEAYPSPSPFNCPKCPVRLICQTMLDGQDPSDLIRQQYMVGPPRD